MKFIRVETRPALRGKGWCNVLVVDINGTQHELLAVFYK